MEDGAVPEASGSHSLLMRLYTTPQRAENLPHVLQRAPPVEMVGKGQAGRCRLRLIHYNAQSVLGSTDSTYTTLVVFMLQSVLSAYTFNKQILPARYTTWSRGILQGGNYTVKVNCKLPGLLYHGLGKAYKETTVQLLVLAINQQNQQLGFLSVYIKF